MRTPLLVSVLAVCGLGCFGDSPSGSRADAGPEAACVLQAEVEAVPGFPFDPKVFRNQIWPILGRACAASGCHDAPAGAGDFTVWPLAPADTDGGMDGGASEANPCDFVRTFNAVYTRSDFRQDPGQSPMYTAVNGSRPDHPALDAEALDILLAYLQDAHDTYAGAAEWVEPSAYFDFDAYQAQIQPALDDAGCLADCHTVAAAAGGFGLHPQPAPDGPELEANFQAVVAQVDIGEPDGARAPMYTRATDDHGGVSLPAANAGVLLQWIEDALAKVPQTEPGCANTDAFDLGVFRDEIMPVLRGDVDLNDRQDGRNVTGCTRGPCHGTEREPGTLYLVEGDPPADNLRRISCFVDQGNPSASQLLVCPLGSSRCTTGEHPGGDIFSGFEDRNLQRLLSYLYAANSDTSPLDFAFFARRINPLFNDRNAVEDGAQGRTCADTLVCHGAPAAGEPPNGSNFGIIPESADEQDLLLNFISAAHFTHFLDPRQSSLFLYPTNEIANLDNDLATGLRHPGGTDFAPDDAEALAILQWADGLRPDEDGFQRHWLVAGEFTSVDVVTEQEIPDEATIRPRIFQLSGQSLLSHQGQWDGFFSGAPFVDLNDPDQGFFRPEPASRMVYAVAYVINSSARDITTLLTVRSPNDVQLSAGDASTLGLDGQGANLLVTLPSYSRSRALTRIMVKVMQQPDDTAFGFDMQLATDSGRPLTNLTRELIIKLSPEGGI